MATLKDKIVLQLISGRFIFTIIVACVFAYLSIIGVLPTDKVMEVTLIVLYAYFNKTRANDINGDNGEVKPK